MSEPPIVRLLYERGAFQPDDTRVLAEILAIFGIGLPAFVLIKAFTPGYFRPRGHAHPDDLRRHLVAVNVSLALSLFSLHGARRHRGRFRRGGMDQPRRCCSAASSGAALGPRCGAAFTHSPPDLAAAAMAGCIYLATRYLADRLASQAHLLEQAVTLGAIVAAAGLVYLVIAFAIGGRRRGHDPARNIRRRGAAARRHRPRPSEGQ